MQSNSIHRFTGLLIGMLLAVALAFPAFAAGADADAPAVHQMHTGHSAPVDCCGDAPTEAGGCLWACMLACAAAIQPAGPDIAKAPAPAIPDGQPAAGPMSHGPPTETPPPKRLV